MPINPKKRTKACSYLVSVKVITTKDKRGVRATKAISDIISNKGGPLGHVTKR